MNLNSSFIRKIIYLVGIVLLLFPLFFLGQPAASDSAGGKLATLRSKYDLSQAELGEIDPAGESVKLATLGMRGVAANLLWLKSDEYKRTENWDKLSATLVQITKLQPNFISVWEYQGHNLSYNISAEFDNYRHRYHWVKRGINFMIDGTRYNKREPRLQHQVGWFIGHKIGRSDEKSQFRPLFRQDQEFHDQLASHVDIYSTSVNGPDGKPDNWLVSRLWYLNSYEMVDTLRIPFKGKVPLVYYLDAPMARMNFADAMESEGYLGEIAQIAWREAGEELNDYGNRDIQTSLGYSLRLNNLPLVESQYEQLQAQFEEMTREARAQVEREKRQELTPEELAVVDRAWETLRQSQYAAKESAQKKLEIQDNEIISRLPAETRYKASRLAKEKQFKYDVAYKTGAYLHVANYRYWTQRCQAEQEDRTIKARKHLFDGNKYYETTDLEKARAEYEQAWQEWSQIFTKYPKVGMDDNSSFLSPYLRRYLVLLKQLDEELTNDFPLRPWLGPSLFGMIKQLGFYIEPVDESEIPGLNENPSPPTAPAPSAGSSGDDADGRPLTPPRDRGADQQGAGPSTADV